MTALHLNVHARRDTTDALQALGGCAMAQAPGHSPWPEQRLRMPAACAQDGLRREVWTTDAPVQSGRLGALHWHGTDDTLYGVIELAEPAAAAQRRGEVLRELTRQAYGHLFALLAERGLPHLWRVWHFMADINAELDGLERYRWFNRGRHDAFCDAGAPVQRQIPAASALGWADGTLSIAFLAGRATPTPIENPRQVSAWQYPASYGPRPPLFSRAVLVHAGRDESLLISGTASIVGHESVHPGDVVAQCEETARNLHEVLRQANRHPHSRGHHRADALIHRAYVRHAADFDAVRDTLQRCLGGAHLSLVQADVCRSELLVEVESVSFAPCKS